MTVELDNLTAAVAASVEVQEKAVALLVDMKSQLDAAIAAGSDGTALQALSDSLAAETAKLAGEMAAVSAAPVETPPVV